VARPQLLSDTRRMTMRSRAGFGMPHLPRPAGHQLAGLPFV
jgi:hypothetical protein